MGWKILEIEEGQTLNLFLNNLVVQTNNDKIIIPLSDIDTIITQNYKLKVTTQLLCAFAENNINFVICNLKHYPSCQLIPIFGNYNALKIFQDQLTWNVTYKNFLWTKIVKQKILNQANFFKFCLIKPKIYEKLIDLSNSVKEFDITNREGDAAKIYWHVIYGVDFSRNFENNINLVLNYGYAVLNTMISRSIIKKGLDPRISICHKSFSNHFALSSDLIEIFRQVIDNKVYEFYKNDEIDNVFVCKQELLKYIANVKVMLNNKQLFLNNAIDIFIDCISKSKTFPDFNIIWNQTSN